MGINFRKSLILAVIFAFVLTILNGFTVYRVSAAMDPNSAWKKVRGDNQNTGMSPLQGNITAPVVSWSKYDKGNIEEMFFEDVVGDAKKEITFIEGGRVILLDSNLNILWTSEIINAKMIKGWYDINSDGIKELVILCGKSLYFLSGTTGNTLLKMDFSGDLNIQSIVMGELNTSTPGLEMAIYFDNTTLTTMYAYYFSSDLRNSYQLWQYYNSNFFYPPEIIITDVNNDSANEIEVVTFGKHIILNGSNGNILSECNFITGGGIGDGRGRNYGLVQSINIDSDSALETVGVFYGSEHTTVWQQSGNSASILWDEFYEWNGASNDVKEMRQILTGVGDLDNDSNVEVTYSVFNDTGDYKWHTLVKSALTQVCELDLPDTYIEDTIDLNGDGRKELLISKQLSRTPTDNTELRVYTYTGSSWVLAGTIGNFKYDKNYFTQMKELDRVSNTSNLGGRDTVVKGDIFNDGYVDFYISNSSGVHASYTFNGTSLIQTMTISNNTPIQITDIDNDGYNEIITSESGTIKVFERNNTVTASNEFGSKTANMVPVAADTDRDNKLEYYLVDNKKINAYEINGNTATLQWQKDGIGECAPANTYNPEYSAVIGDVENDSLDELIVAGKDQSTGYTKIQVLDPQGNKKWEKVLTGIGSLDTSIGIYEFGLMNFNYLGSGSKAIYLNVEGGLHNENVRIIDCGGAHDIIVSQDRYSNVGAGSYIGFPAVYDRNGDGADDLIIAACNYLNMYSGNTGAVSNLINATNWGPPSDAIIYSTPIVCDLNNDSTKEIVAGAGLDGTGIYDGSTLAKLWQQSNQRWDLTTRLPGIGDVDGDNWREIGVNLPTGMFYCYNGTTGALKWSYNLGTGTITTHISTADIDGDGRYEFIFGTNYGKLIALNGGTDSQLKSWGEQRELWEVDLGYKVGSPIITDTDNDGKAEILVMVADGKLYCIDQDPLGPTPTPAPELGTNLALGKTMTASSIWGAGNDASKANDSSNTTFWSPAPGTGINDWIEINFGAPVTFNKIITKESPNYDNRIKSYKLQYWDGARWVDLTTGTTVGSGQIDTVSVTTAIRVRFLILGTDPGNPTLSEFEVYYSEGGSIPEPLPIPTPTETNLAAGKTMTASSIWGEGCEAAKANDGDTSTFWNPIAGSGINEWLQVDFSTSTTFNKVVTKECPLYNNRITSYRIQYWSGTQWTDCFTGTTVGTSRTDYFSSITTTKVRFLILNTVAGNPTIAEFEVYDDPNIIPHSQMTAVATSQHTSYEANKAIDDNTSTIWHSEWSPMAYLPQSITLNLGGTYNVYKLTYLPRQDSLTNGTITRYTIYTSGDGTNFTPIVNGSWANTYSEKEVTFAPTRAAFIRLEATDGSGGFASAAEINVAGEEYDGPIIIPHSQMTASTTSQHTGNEANKSIDGNSNTMWHSEWIPMAYLPQSIIINLGGTYFINDLKYLPRQDTPETNGIITEYKIYVSTNGINFIQVAYGSWANSYAEKEVAFSPISASYVKLEAVAGSGGYASAAEINIGGQ